MIPLYLLTQWLGILDTYWGLLLEWHLMSATAVIALGLALLVTLFAQEYVIKGLRI